MRCSSYLHLYNWLLILVRHGRAFRILVLRISRFPRFWRRGIQRMPCFMGSGFVLFSQLSQNIEVAAAVL